MHKSTETKKSSLQSYVKVFTENSLDNLKGLYQKDELIEIFEAYQADAHFGSLVHAGITLLINHLDLGDAKRSAGVPTSLPANLMTPNLKRILYHYCIAEVSKNPTLAPFMSSLNESIIRDLLAKNKRESIALILNKGTLDEFLKNYKIVVEKFKASLLGYKNSWRVKSAAELKALDDFFKVDLKSRNALSEYLDVLKKHEVSIGYGATHVLIDLRTYAEQLINDYEDIIKPKEDSLFKASISELDCFIQFIACEEFCGLLKDEQFQQLCNKYERTYRDVMNALYPHHTCAKLRSVSELAKDAAINAANNSTPKSSDSSSSSTNRVTQNEMSTPRVKSALNRAWITPPANNPVPFSQNFVNFFAAAFVKNDGEPSLEMIDIIAGMNILNAMNTKDHIYLMTPMAWDLTKPIRASDMKPFFDELMANKNKICFCIVNISKMHWVSLISYPGDKKIRCIMIDPSKRGTVNKVARRNMLNLLFNQMSDHLKVEINFQSIPITQQDYDYECGYCCLETGKDVITEDLFKIENGEMTFDHNKLRLQQEYSSFPLQFDLIEVKKFWCRQLTRVTLIALDINDQSSGETEYDHQDIRTKIDRKFHEFCKDKMRKLFEDHPLEVPKLEGEYAKLIDSFLLKKENQALLRKYGLNVATDNGKIGIRDRLHIFIVNKHKEMVCDSFNDQFIQHLKSKSPVGELSDSYQADELRKIYDEFIRTSGLSPFIKKLEHADWQHFPRVEKAVGDKRRAEKAVIENSAPKVDDESLKNTGDAGASSPSNTASSHSILLEDDEVDAVRMDATK